MQHLVDDDGVERAARRRELIHVALADGAVARARALEIDARHGEHLARQIDAERALDARRHHFEHAPGAGADVEQVVDRLVGQELDQRRLDLALADMERADAVPVLRVGAEIGFGRGAPLPLHLVEPLAVERHDRVLGRQHGDEPLGRAARAAARQAIEHPVGLAEAVEQPGLAQQFQVARHARLALAENVGQLAHGQLALGAQRQKPEPGRLGGGAQGGQKLFHGTTPLAEELPTSAYKHIRI